MPEYLSFHNVSFAYGDFSVLDDISFRVKEGESTGILGPNGAGKTTLLKCILRSLHPNSGKIRIREKPQHQLSPEENARICSYVPQEVNTPFAYTVFEMVMMARYPSTPVFGTEIREREVVEKAMKETGVHSLSSRHFSDLSGGEKQLVLVARAMAQQAPLMLLDEPSSSLDIHHTTKLLTLLRNRAKQRSGAILFVTHDINFASALADRIILLKQGRTIASGPPPEVMTSKNLEELYETPVRIITDHDTGKRFFTYQLDI